MEITKFIELGVKKTGSQKELAKALDIDVTVLSAIKAGKRGLSNVNCIRLADLIEVERIEVIAASELVTEKNEDKRKILKSCFSRAATVAAAAVILGATTIVTSSPANASQASSDLSSIYIM